MTAQTRVGNGRSRAGLGQAQVMGAKFAVVFQLGLTEPSIIAIVVTLFFAILSSRIFWKSYQKG